VALFHQDARVTTNLSATKEIHSP